MYPYLYLAPRGQAKTYEAASFVDNRTRAGFKTTIFVANQRMGELFSNKLQEKSRLVKILHDLNDVERVNPAEVRVFDEFDLLFQNFNKSIEIRQTDRFYGTPLKKRNITNLQKDDILAKILSATNGHYHGRMWAECFDKNIFDKMKEEMPDEQFDLEVLGNFWESK